MVSFVAIDLVGIEQHVRREGEAGLAQRYSPRFRVDHFDLKMRGEVQIVVEVMHDESALGLGSQGRDKRMAYVWDQPSREIDFAVCFLIFQHPARFISDAREGVPIYQ